jgi:hypothetical protein
MKNKQNPHFRQKYIPFCSILLHDLLFLPFRIIRYDTNIALGRNFSDGHDLLGPASIKAGRPGGFYSGCRANYYNKLCKKVRISPHHRDNKSVILIILGYLNIILNTTSYDT